ncbi:lysozyme [Streptococcus thermophilus]|nr:lysozyme [Streptococcus thermophilus]MCE2299707.1 lysozyme [Streptococcus thermophilus]MCE2301171.1 lysozyme [Streptococcus thermophilus]MCE2303212.1 lysozyme [Streptococcus thermophilus]MCE2306518.1 lysozyme [Streptococcus thermophilus]
MASSEVASEIDRSATSEVAEARPTDREAVDTSLRTVSTNASHPGADGLVTADVFLDIPSNGTFYFRRTTEIRTAPVMDIKPTFVFSSGDHVIYDKVLKRDNHQWISYVSYNGTRRYVDLGVVVESLAKPRGDMAIESHDNGDFSVVISNVSDQNGVVGVSVPIWSERNGQDDIIWYNATRLNNRNYKVNVGLSDHKNERGLYNVHLYFVETNGKLVGVGGTTYTVPAKVEETHITTGHSLPDSGTYTFKERSIIKAEPSVVSPELAYYDAGMSVNYDKVVTADGHTWLSYVSRGGNRRYIAIDGKATAVAQSASPSLAITGTYTFTKPSSIKAQPSVASPELAYYDKVMSVRYDKVLTADGHTWLSYVTYSGLRRYMVDIS